MTPSSFFLTHKGLSWLVWTVVVVFDTYILYQIFYFISIWLDKVALQLWKPPIFVWLACFRWKRFNSSVDEMNVCSLLSPSAKFLPLLCSPPNAMLGGKRETLLGKIGFDRERVSLVKSVLSKCWIMIATHYSGPRLHIKYILDTLLLGLIVGGNRRGRWSDMLCMCFVHFFRATVMVISYLGQHLHWPSSMITAMMTRAIKVGVYTTQTETGTVRWHNQLLWRGQRTLL